MITRSITGVTTCCVCVWLAAKMSATGSVTGPAFASSSSSAQARATATAERAESRPARSSASSLHRSVGKLNALAGTMLDAASSSSSSTEKTRKMARIRY